jgi:deoxyguanosine kinase
VIQAHHTAGQLPRYIAVEGPIGVGKTSLAQRLSATFNYDTLLEKAQENPFLERFYQDPRRHALSTQLFFLFQRGQQIQELRQEDLFQPVRVADFLIDKDRLFAQQNLEPDEFELYLKIYQHLTLDAPQPDLVIYLQAPTGVLLQRIKKRGIPAEQLIELDYLENLSDAYTEFFHFYQASPLLIVNTAEIDLISKEDDYQQLIDYISTMPGGTHYFNPRPSLV